MRCEKCRYEQDAPFEICPSCATPVKTVQKAGSTAAGTGARKKKLSKKRRIRMIKRISLFTAALIALIVVVSLRSIRRQGGTIWHRKTYTAVHHSIKIPEIQLVHISVVIECITVLASRTAN